MTDNNEPSENDVAERCEACEQMRERSDEAADSLARVQADYANYRRRTEDQAAEARQRAAEHVINDVLQVVDSFELALRQAPEEGRGEFYRGMELIMSQLVSVLEEHGVERVPVDAFDPRLHEAILTAQSQEPKGSIIEVLQHGYSLGSKVLRTAKVKVSAGAEEDKK